MSNEEQQQSNEHDKQDGNLVNSSGTSDNENLKQKIIDLKNEGNQQFKAENYEEAIKLYVNSLELTGNCVEWGDNNDETQTIVILNSNIAAAKFHLNLFDEALEYCNKALELNESHSKALFKRAQIYEKLDKLDESLADYKRYSEMNPDDKKILPIINKLSIRIQERNEKLKAEMLSKLKDLGNVVLKPFGLSTDNFKLEKNPETGGYSVNFQNNK